MVKPPALKPGDMIGVMAPSSYVEKDDIEKSKTVLESRGYKVFIHPQTYERENQSAGTHLQKTLALQGLWQREDIKAIWAAGGGNRALHLIKSINFDTMKKKPKIFMGFSDATVLLNAVYAHTGIPTFHTQVFKNIHKYAQLDELLVLLAGKKISMPQEDAKIIQDGKAEGVLIGGNLSLFSCLPNVLPGEFWKDGILFLEDINEEASRLDRAILHLKNLGVLKSVKGIVFGQFEKTQETGRAFGYSIEEIIREHTQDLKIPVVMNAPFGHGSALHPLPVGIKAKLKAQKGKFSLETAESAVTV